MLGKSENGNPLLQSKMQFQFFVEGGNKNCQSDLFLVQSVGSLNVCMQLLVGGGGKEGGGREGEATVTVFSQVVWHSSLHMRLV